MKLIYLISHVSLIFIIGLLCNSCQKTSPGLDYLPENETNIVQYLQQNKKNLDPIEGIYFKKYTWTLTNSDSITEKSSIGYQMIYIFKYKDWDEHDVFLSGTFINNEFRKHYVFKSTDKEFIYRIYKTDARDPFTLPREIDFNRFWGFTFTQYWLNNILDSHIYNEIKDNYKKIYPIPK